MADAAPLPRTFDRAEVEAILLEAARLDDATSGAPRITAAARVDADALTLGEIERAAGEVGISRTAVSTASLRIALRAATPTTPRLHLVHEIHGVLPAEALESVADDVRTRVPSARVRVTADGFDVEVGKAEGEPGSLLVKVRARADGATLSVWSAAPAWTRGDVAAIGMVGVPSILFPVVASASGAWPALATALGLGAVGLAAGTGIGVAANRWRIGQWHDRVADVVTTIAASVAARTTERVLPAADSEP